MRQQRIRAIAAWAAMLAVLYGQQAPPAAAPATAPQTTAPVATVAPAQPARAPLLNLQNASLTEVIDMLARQLKINYILDPRVKGSVTVNTYGEMRELDVRGLLDTLLRVNGAAMVQTGDLYRIVPLADVARLADQPSNQSAVGPERRADVVEPDFPEVRDGRRSVQAPGEVPGRRRHHAHLRSGQPPADSR